MLYNGPYLRVISPRTTNGTLLEIDDEGKVVTKESHLPLTAKVELERQNRSLPPHLKKKIEIVHGKSQLPTQPPQAVVDNRAAQELEEQKATIAQLQAQVAQLLALHTLQQKPQELQVNGQGESNSAKASKPTTPATDQAKAPPKQTTPATPQ